MINLKTYNDYWSLVDLAWDNLIIMAADQLDFESPAYKEPGNPNSPLTGNSILEEMTFLKNRRDQKLVRYFNAIWILASESYAYSKPGWSDLCALCSEEYLIHEEQDKPTDKSEGE